MIKKTLAEKLRTKKYYKLAHQGSTDLSHPAMKLLIERISPVKKILDLGCGEGTRLFSIIDFLGGAYEGVGIDSNKKAINMAKQQYKSCKFINEDLEKLRFNNDSFDLAFSAYVFEHLEHPEKVLIEAARVVKENGTIVIIAPNFGSPNRRSPNSIENKFLKLMVGLAKDLIINKNLNFLDWTKVTPQTFNYNMIDADATCEPYINTLIGYCNYLGLKIEYADTFWEIDKFSLFQLPFRMLGLLKIYPFYMWGPHFCVIMKKRKRLING